MRKNDDIIAIYSRKSKFTGKGESIGNQVELCKEYVRVHYGDAAVDKVVVYEDEGFSGGNLNRPDFKKMMDAAKKRKFKAIIVYRLDRISRNISDFASLIEELARLDISFVSIKEQFDTSTPMGRAMMYIASVFSQLERETIAERIRDNMHELAKTGRWLGGTTPTGYASEAVKSITIDGKSKKACKLKLIPDEADIVRMIYDLYVETDSLTLTEAALIKQGIKTKNNNYFTRFSIKAILQNPVYMIADEDAYNFFIQNDTDLFSEKDAFDNQHGIMAYNRTDQEKGRATKYLPASEWIVSVGKHPGLIPGKVWVQIQESLERNKSKSFRKPRSNEALLTGLLFCSCGERMYPKMSKRKTADDKVIYTYVCKMKERSQRSVCNTHCRACTPTPHFTSDGYVSACDLVTFGNAPHHMECFVYGKWDEAANEFKFDHNKIKRLQLRTTENIAHCRDCSVKEHCGGYCLGEVMNETGKLDGRKEIACYGVKKLFSAIGNEIYAYRYFHP